MEKKYLQLSDMTIKPVSGRTIQQLNNKNIRIVFFGTPDVSLSVLNALDRADYQIVCVISKPDQPVGRKQTLTPTPVSLWAISRQIPLLKPETNPDRPWLFANPSDVTRKVLKYKPDLIITADYTQKIPFDLLSNVKFGGINVHPSLLPAYRGPAPVPWAILKGESETGVSIVTINDKFDCGKIIAQENEPILSTDTTETLLPRLFTKGANLLIQILQDFQSQPTTYNLQPTTKPSYFPRLTRNDGFVPWNIINSALKGIDPQQKWLNSWPIAKYFDKGTLIHNSLFIIHNSYRAFHPWPGLWTKIKVNGEEKRLKLLKVHLDPKPYPLNPILIFDEIQFEGKSPTTDVDYWIKRITS